MPRPRWLGGRVRPYVLRIPNPGTKGKQAVRRWHKVNMADAAWTQCNIPIGTLWERSAILGIASDTPLCKWCFPKS